MRHMPMILRQVRRSYKQAGLFVLCVALSLATLTAFSGFARSVGRALLDDARTLHAADIIIRSHDPISAPLVQAVDRLADQGRIVRANVHEFYSVVRAPDKKASVLSRLKVVEPGYPFYGQVTLKSGRPFKQVLAPGACIVEQTLLDRIGLKVGDRLQVGYTTLTVDDVVTAEPDRPLDLFAFGPRVFIHSSDLDALGLLATGSHIHRVVLLMVMDPLQVDDIAGRLKKASAFDGESVDTYLTSGSVVKRFLDNFLFFLKLVGLFILMVSGLGIQSTLTALFNEKQRTIAVMKTVGASGRFINTHFTCSWSLCWAPREPALAFWPVRRSRASWPGCWARCCPSGPGPDHRLVRGGRGRHAGAHRRRPVFVPAPVPAQGDASGGHFQPPAIRRHRPLAQFSLRPPGPALFSCSGAVAHARHSLRLLFCRRRYRPDSGCGPAGPTGAVGDQTPARSSSGLSPGHTGPVSTGQCHPGDHDYPDGFPCRDLRGPSHRKEPECHLRAVLPPDSPNAFFVDIQPDQTDAFSAAMARPVQFYPIVRARITKVNGEAIDRSREGQKRRDNLSRVFNLTYREALA